MAMESDKKTPHEGNGQKDIEMSPIQLLAVILKAKLQERITDEEVETICTVYFETIQAWWGEDE